MKLVNILFIAIFALTAPAIAQVIQAVSADSQWNTMVVPNHDGVPFWDNTSFDGDPAGGGANAGFYLTGNFGFTGPTSNAGANTIYTPGGLSSALNQNPANWQYLSTVSTPYANNTETGPAAFGLAGGKSYTFTDLGSLCGNTNNVMGWFSISDPSTLHPIFTGHSPASLQVTVNATGPIGLYFTSSGSNATERSTDSLPAQDGDNDNDDNLNRNQVIGNGMAVFRQTQWPPASFGTVFIGFEDTWDVNFNGDSTFNDGFRGDSDYNDLMVGISYCDIPEPGTTSLIFGAAALAFIIVRRRNNS